MLVKLKNSNVSINTNYITAIEHLEENVVNSSGDSFEYLLYMVDGQQWYVAEEDYHKISINV